MDKQNMQHKQAWLLPDGIEAVLPHDAKRLETLRRKLLDTFASWGYELVIPPFIDFLDSLLTGSGHDLALQTFTLTDQISGKLLGIRADMTPQVARIDAHNLAHDKPNRLCYVGTVLHTRGDPLEKTRSPMQIGAELYGHSGKESDVEVICLMLETLAMTGLLNVHLDIGHVGIYRALAQQAQLTTAQENALFAVLQRKDKTELRELLDDDAVDEPLKALFLALVELNGDESVLEKAEQLFACANEQVKQALAELKAIACAVMNRFPHLPISFDLAELRGYRYHTGVVFAAFVPSMGREIARGGRYDNIGAVFGRARPATGFSADLHLLSALSKTTAPVESSKIIIAPCLEDKALLETITALRAQGHTVIQQLSSQTDDLTENTALLIQDIHSNWVVSH